MVLNWFWPVLFYLMGSIPTGYLIARSRDIDIRQHGSGNIGATNVGRVMGRNWGLFAFACDFLKGFLLLYLVRHFEFPDDKSWPTALLLVLCGMAAILGHNFTPWLGFKGGKGVATTGGVLTALMPWTFLVVLAIWAVLVLLTRTVSIGSIAAGIALPFAAAFLYPGQWIYFGLALLGGALVVWRHRSNIQRLLAGTEPRLGTRVPTPPTP
jgi:glycerol-3-phosphate acyltransferase PlsY